MTVVEAGPSALAHVLEQHAMDQPGVFLEINQPVAIDPEDFPDVVLAEGSHAGMVARALDDHLVRADAGHHVIDSVAPLVEVALDLQRREAVGHDPDPPARSVGAAAKVAIGDDLRRSLVLLALA